MQSPTFDKWHLRTCFISVCCGNNTQPCAGLHKLYDTLRFPLRIRWLGQPVGCFSSNGVFREPLLSRQSRMDFFALFRVLPPPASYGSQTIIGKEVMRRAMSCNDSSEHGVQILARQSTRPQNGRRGSSVLSLDVEYATKCPTGCRALRYLADRHVFSRHPADHESHLIGQS